MAKQKVKITQKELPLLRGDLNIDLESLNKLKTLQKRFAAKFKNEIAQINIDTAKYYDQRIESLTKAKAETQKKYTAEIKKYQSLARALKGKPVAPVKQSTTKRSTSKKDTPKA